MRTAYQTCHGFPLWSELGLFWRPFFHSDLWIQRHHSDKPKSTLKPLVKKGGGAWGISFHLFGFIQKGVYWGASWGSGRNFTSGNLAVGRWGSWYWSRVPLDIGKPRGNRWDGFSAGHWFFFSSEKDLSCSLLILIFIGEIIVAYIPFVFLVNSNKIICSYPMSLMYAMWLWPGLV